MPQIDTSNRVRSTKRSKTNRSNSPPRSHSSVNVELKGSVFTLSVLHLRSFDVDAIGQDLKKRIEQAPSFFKNAPIVLDLKDLSSINQAFNFSSLVKELRQNYQLIPVGVRRGSPMQNKSAVEAGLAILQGLPIQNNEEGQNVEPETNREKKQIAPTEQSDATGLPKIIEHPIRSGQQVYVQNGDLVVMAAVNAGAEVLADGNIHIYAPLRGRALAGIQGNHQARIFCQSMQAELISIAGNYRVFDDKVPEQYQGKPVQIYLQADRLVMSPFRK